MSYSFFGKKNVFFWESIFVGCFKSKTHTLCMISNLDLLMLIFKYLPKDTYPSNPGLKSSTYGPSMPRVGYSDEFEKYSGEQCVSCSWNMSQVTSHNMRTSYLSLFTIEWYFFILYLLAKFLAQ